MITLDRPAKIDYPEIPYKEVVRYLGGHRVEISGEAQQLVLECIDEIGRVMEPRAVYERYPVEYITEDEVKLSCMHIHSKKLARHINGSSEVILFAATIGVMVDRKIRAAELTSAAKAAVFQAAGAAAVEAYCDDLNARLDAIEIEKGYTVCKRFSPGYGDFPLEHQRDFFRVLDCTSKIGITLTDGLLMVPTKSVTALIGIKH